MIQFIKTENSSIFLFRKISILKGLNDYRFLRNFSQSPFPFTSYKFSPIEYSVIYVLFLIRELWSYRLAIVGYEGNKGMWNSEGKPVVPDINLLH